MTRFISTLITIVMGIVFISSCSNEPLEEPEQVELKLIGITQEMFDAKYGNPIIIDDYVIQINAQPTLIPDGEDYVVSTTNQLKSENPDIILTSGLAFPNLIREGLLLQIDYLLEMNVEETEGYAPSIMQKLRNDGGDGNLYGLPTTFSSDVLYYNKDLFDKYSTPHPKDGMSLSEILELEKALLTNMVKNENVYGLLESKVGEASSKLDQIIREYAMSEGIKDIDSSNRRIELDTEDWRRIWQEIINAYTNYSMIVRSKTAEVPYKDGVLSFVSQMSPLMLGGDYNWHNWIASDELPFNWGVVTPPGRYNIYYQQNVIAIRGDSSKKEAAWELIKYITSADTTERLLSIVDDGSFPPKGYRGEFPSRIKLMEERKKVNLTAFYIQDPAMDGLYSSSNNAIPDEFYIEYRESRIEHIQAVLDGELTVDEAIVDLQQEVQTLLEKWAM